LIGPQPTDLGKDNGRLAVGTPGPATAVAMSLSRTTNVIGL
jgi:hypothetical protein